MTRPRPLEVRQRQAKRRRKSYLRRKAEHSHPLLTHDELLALRGAAHEEPAAPIGPDRSTYAGDADRQAAIEAHARRVARKLRPTVAEAAAGQARARGIERLAKAVKDAATRRKVRTR